MRYLIAFLALSGCEFYQWTTFEFRNTSTVRIRLEEVSGITPDPSPGNLVPDARARMNLGGPIRIDEEVELRWLQAGETKVKTLARADMGLPEKIRGGLVQFRFTAQEDWRVRYIRHPVDDSDSDGE